MTINKRDFFDAINYADTAVQIHEYLLNILEKQQKDFAENCNNDNDSEKSKALASISDVELRFAQLDMLSAIYRKILLNTLNEIEGCNDQELKTIKNGLLHMVATTLEACVNDFTIEAKITIDIKEEQ
ncbi:hypothetical protein AVI51_02895 [Piscirickettsia salmonis]|uniref:Uncharacterized protein n=1 Tax=Piscirickettsia salmonis TaxID=1238 RepID=A0A9Q5VA26_PISSA|nr:hypothetical protein [Piscirickettsia salmonis]RNC77229.1 hypothetical protein DA717_11425 [Piscirickettsiaceae bacterium NZ-RLO2]ALA25014.1 transporter [Piscirickettsia salmonis]APS45304.1 hypothetical protein AVI48_13615 [Piscirickettsia salmonis]APS48664.1 hypothetical protein AVI49_14225 [Piscirickettsia salmonis]APS49909.1 hypothetical protein AVI50_02935 [Piscirickettsia salmonis]